MKDAAQTDSASARAEAPFVTCLNCGAELDGQYCARCGQRARVRVLSLWALLREVAGDLLDFDSRMWRTLRPLAFNPGRLTQEYLRGRRASYTPPFRLYLVLSLAFFLLNSFGGGPPMQVDIGAADEPEPGATAPVVGIVVTPPEEASVRRAVEADADPCGAESLRLELGASGEIFETRMREACRRVTGDPEGFTRELNQNVPRMMFLFLPLVALLLQLLHLRSRRFYVEHLLFCVHFHAFFFFAMLLLAVLEALAATLGENAAGSLASGAGNAFGMLLLFYVPWYLYRGMRVVYGEGPRRTVAKMVLLGAGYSVFLLLTGLGLLAYTAISL